VEAAIARRFQLTNDAFRHPIIKTADFRALNTEKEQITSAAGHDWPGMADYPAFDVRIEFQDCETARMNFMRWFEKAQINRLAATPRTPAL
jgi:hypothetical protein